MSSRNGIGTEQDSRKSTDDFNISLGVTYLCQESLEALDIVAGAVEDPQRLRTLEEVKRSRQMLLGHPLPPISRLEQFIDEAPESLKKESGAYQELKLVANTLTEEDLLARLYQADRLVSQQLRNSVKSVQSLKLAVQLSAVVADFQVSSDRIKACL